MPNMAKMSFFFGAGAEVDYGLPLGGKFALEIFRYNVEEEKKKFRENLKQIPLTSVYANEWLPKGFENKRIHTFGKNEFVQLIESSIEVKREQILGYINNFDRNVSKVLENWHVSEEIIQSRFQEIFSFSIGTNQYDQLISIHPALRADTTLFKSEYFSAFLEIIRKHPTNNTLSKCVGAILQILIASFGQRLVQDLNQEVFTEAPDDIPVFDDVSGLFRLEFSKAGTVALELVIEKSTLKTIDQTTSIEELFGELARAIIEDMFSIVLDYQSLIDSHFRYLYCPKTEWAKFSKMVIFLNTVRSYITTLKGIDYSKIKNGPGYYHDLKGLTNHDIICIGTSNYNNFVSEVLQSTGINAPIYHLNGSVLDFYNPYKNRIISNAPIEKIPKTEIYVPFIFTQSGVKPLTSVEMSKRYVDLYENFMKSDLVVVIGYGFNGDDGHINGLFRDLVEIGKKKLYIVEPQGTCNPEIRKKQLKAKLRIEDTSKIEVLQVQTSTRMIDGRSWISLVG